MELNRDGGAKNLLPLRERLVAPHAHLRGRGGAVGRRQGGDEGRPELGGGFEYAHTKLALGIEARGPYLCIRSQRSTNGGRA